MAAAVCAATAAAEAITMTTTTTPPDNESMSPLWVFMASQDSSNSKAGQKRLYACTDDNAATIYYSADPLAAIRQYNDTTPSTQAPQAQRGRQQQQPVVLGSNALTVKPRSTRHTHRLDEALENNNKAQIASSSSPTTTTVYTACGEKVLSPQTTWHIHMVIGPLHKHTSAQAMALLWNTCQPNVTSKLEWGADIARHFELQCYCSASLTPKKEEEEEE
jgi:hypothetical protein